MIYTLIVAHRRLWNVLLVKSSSVSLYVVGDYAQNVEQNDGKWVVFGMGYKF